MPTPRRALRGQDRQGAGRAGDGGYRGVPGQARGRRRAGEARLNGRNGGTTMKNWLVGAAVAATMGIAPGIAPATAQTVKIGFVATFSGPAGALGQALYDGFMLGI